MPLTLLAVQHIRKSYGPRVLLDDVSFNIAENEHIGFIGRNGAGKSTLLKIIAGLDTADAGEIAHMPQLRLGYLEQHEDFVEDESAMTYLQRKSNQPDWACAKMAGRFQIKPLQLNQASLAFSGGYRMRLKLAALLLQDPNLLLLDEPTNFLDLQTVLLLEEFLRSFRGSFILVSHDREFLKNTCDITMEVDRGNVERYNGPIEEWLSFKAERLAQQEQHNKTIEAQRRHMQDFVDRFRYKESKAKQAQERLKRIAKLEKIDIQQPLKTSRIRIPPTDGRKGTVLRLQECAIGYGDRVIANQINAEWNRGEHIAVLGENGQGKTTLLKTLDGRIPPLDGNVRWGHKLHIASYAQHVHEALDETETVGSYLSRHGSSLLPEDVLRMAGNFLFSIEDLEKTCSLLSGGEKARLCLAGILLEKPDVLLLDEPTNHLDMETVEALGSALQEWNGTVFFVSHSRTFVHLVASAIIEVQDRHVTTYPGTYDEYVWDLKRRLELRPNDQEESTIVEIAAKKTARQERYQLLKKKRNDAQKLEKELESLGAQKRRLLDEMLEQPGNFSLERNRKLSTIDTMIHHIENEWGKVLEEVWKLELEG